MGGFGWQEENRESEIQNVYKYFFEGKNVPDRSEKLYELLVSEVSPAFYDESCYARFDFGRLKIEQWDKKEFFHDGSEQSYKIFTLDTISEEEYNSAKENGIFVKPRFLYYSDEWFSELEDYFFVRTKSIYERYDIYARDLYSLGFVKLTLDK